MRQRMIGLRKGLPAMASAGLIAGLLAGCGGGSGGDPGDGIGNLFARGAFAGVSQQAVVDTRPASEAEVVCPNIDVRDGSASHRVYAGGQTNESLRYQYSLGDAVRECRVAGGQLLIKVGVEGKVLLGPAGQPSSFNVPVYVGVRQDNGERVLASRVYSAPVSIPAGQSQGSFAIVSDELAVPFVRENANDDYTVYVGFENPGRATPQRQARRQRRGQ